MSDIVRAYHFVGATLRDGRPIPVNGEWLIHPGPVEMCCTGLHASIHPFDALQFAPGATLCLVDCREDMAHQPDKLVCRQRRIVARIDATILLRQFACTCALDVAHLWKCPVIVRQYLETGDESIRAAAWDAARAAAGAAAGAAAWVAAQAAAGAAAGDAAWAAAGDAARAAAWAAAWAAAGAAARIFQRQRFTTVVEQAFRGEVS